MKAIIFIAFIIVYLTTNFVVLARYQEDDQIHWWDTDDNNEYQRSKYEKRVPFPQCLLSKRGSKMFDSSSFQRLFDKKLREEEESLKYDGESNYQNDYEGNYDNEGNELRYGSNEGRTVARAAIKVTRDLLTVLMCDLNGTDTDNIQAVMDKFKISSEFCSYREKPSCDGKTFYRTITGVCNNLANPYDGSSQTAFGRLLSPAYQDGLSEPRRKSVKGGLLPSCRYISLNMGSAPIFNRNYNNFFVIFGQFIAHDMALSVPVSDTYSRPISSCTCSDKYDWDKCNVIPIAPDDPYLRDQKCMAFPATAQAFHSQLCSLGVKQQMNGNTHLPDLSVLYGSTTRTALALRSDFGLLKTSRFPWSKYELPPGQREGKSCTDATKKRKCFAGGDNRLSENLLLTGIQSIFLRLHNKIARIFREKFPLWTSDQIYEETRALNIAFFQNMIYQYFLPILVGPKIAAAEFPTNTKTIYKEEVKPIVYTEFATVVFRLHSLVRDLFTRCTHNLKRIDEVWLHDILHKVKHAYDMEYNGVDALLCGSFFDYGFAADANFAHQIHNRLFESTNSYNKLWRNDLIAINICRSREHANPSYNEFRKFAGLMKAKDFTDFGDTINYEGIQKLRNLYRSPDDVDSFVGVNFEDPVEGGLLGPVSTHIIVKQFKDARDGDRFSYSHEGVLTDEQYDFVTKYPVHCLICQTVHLEKVPENPFKPPSDSTNPLRSCSECDNIQFDPPESGKIQP